MGMFSRQSQARGLGSGGVGGPGGFASSGPSSVPASGGGGGGFTNTKSISFDGTNSYVVTTSNNTAQDFTTTYSLSTWAKSSSWAGQNDFSFVDKSFVTRPGYWLSAGPANKLAAWCLLTSGSYTAYSGSVNVYDGAWHHIVITWSSNTLKIYVDAVEDTSKTLINNSGNTSMGSNTTALTIGCRNAATPAGFWTGKQTNMSIWNIALNASQIAELRNGGKPADLSATSMFANCKGWYKLGDGDAAGSGGVLDSSGNGFHATMNGNAAIVADVP
jgi:hypothetical protein